MKNLVIEISENIEKSKSFQFVVNERIYKELEYLSTNTGFLKFHVQIYDYSPKRSNVRKLVKEFLKPYIFTALTEKEILEIFQK